MSKDVLKLAETLMARHGLTRWKVRFNRRLRCTEARVVCRTKMIELNPVFVDDPEQVILHEIAHAIHWERIRGRDPNDLRPSEELGHGQMWKTICAEVGYMVPDYYCEDKTA